MDNKLIQDFLLQFDDARFPAGFLSDYEAMECLAYREGTETLLVKHRKTGKLHIAKCYSDKSLLSRHNEAELLKKLSHRAAAYIGNTRTTVCCAYCANTPRRAARSLRCRAKAGGGRGSLHTHAALRYTRLPACADAARHTPRYQAAEYRHNAGRASPAHRFRNFPRL